MKQLSSLGDTSRMMSNKDSLISFPALVVYVDLNAIVITFFLTYFESLCNALQRLIRFAQFIVEAQDSFVLTHYQSVSEVIKKLPRSYPPEGLGEIEGESEGLCEELKDGLADGDNEELKEGEALGDKEGLNEGERLEDKEGLFEGLILGLTDGLALGLRDGLLEELILGEIEGEALGLILGLADGEIEGE